MKHYDYVIVGSGLFGATFSRLAMDAGKTCLIIDSRDHIGGNCYSEDKDGIEVHVYGPHIFHTNDKGIWEFVNRFTEFNNFILSPKANYKGQLYSLPFNMNTFYEMWGTKTPAEAKEMIESQKFQGEPTNLEEQALSLVGKDVYEKLIKDYTKKQWKKDPKDLPEFIIKRLPVRFTYDNNYFNDRYQGIPIDGYTKMIERMMEGADVETSTNYFDNRDYYHSICNTLVFTGKIDEFYNYEFGELEYRTLDFQHETHNTDNYQGAAIVNYTDDSVPYTRCVEHKHFTGVKTNKTIVTKEIPAEWNRTKTPYYPINDEKNMKIFGKYKEKSLRENNTIFGGRLSEYRYYDMHQVIGSAMATWKKESKIV